MGDPARLLLGHAPSCGARNDTGGSPGPLATAGSMAARGELSSVPWSRSGAGIAYTNLGYNDFAGPTDMRLAQLNRAAADENRALLDSLRSTFPNDDFTVYGRAKTPASIFGKLAANPGLTVGTMKDLSAARVDISIPQPEWVSHRRIENAIQEAYGGNLLVKDYIARPSTKGYRGRLHVQLPSEQLAAQELQIGSRDLSLFIDHEVENARGELRSLHDLVYKGDMYGMPLPEELRENYRMLLRELSRNDAMGTTIAQNDELAQAIETYYSRMTAAVPEEYPPIPTTLSPDVKARVFAGHLFQSAGALGGALQAKAGYDELTETDTIAGTVQLASGGASIVSGVAGIAGRTVLGVGTGGAAAILDGSRDVYLGIRDADVEQTAVGGVKGTAGSIMVYGALTANPFVVGAGAAAYAGAVVYESREAIAEGASAAWNWTVNTLTGWW